MEHGYRLVCCAPKMDLFFIRADILEKETDIPVLESFRKFTGIRFHHTPHYDRDKLVVSYPEMQPLKSLPWRKR
jgi:hypothetical protein